MSQVPYGLTPTEYLRYRQRYAPKRPRVIFVFESPPKSGKYFYNPDGLVSEPLFSAIMKDVLKIKPANKDEGLREFAANGYLLLDATYSPVNHPHLSPRERDNLILDDLPILVEELRKYANADTKVVLVKTNVCKLLDSRLTELGFAILNHGRTIPFPSTGQQKKFRKTIRHVLGLDPVPFPVKNNASLSADVENPVIPESASTPCPFCHPPANRIMFRDELVYGLWDGFPASPGHALIIPQRHMPTWFDASDEERTALFKAVDSAKVIIEKSHRPDGYNIGINCGPAAGQTIFHLHVHLIPRYSGDVADPRGGVRYVLPHKGNYIKHPAK